MAYGNRGLTKVRVKDHKQSIQTAPVLVYSRSASLPKNVAAETGSSL